MKDIQITIGSDPELFVKKDGKFVSGHELIPGTKDHPHPVRGGAVQVDGTALEFNTKPALTRRQFHASTNAVVKALREMIPNDFELIASPTAEFGNDYLSTLPREAVELGCSPDYDAYTGRENPRPNAEADFRTGAGHVHVGWTQEADITDPAHLAECRAVVQALDIFLGVPSIWLDRDEKRRTLYGQAGAFRPKAYGVEYRVLSNFWVLDKVLRGWVFDNTILALKRLQDRQTPLADHEGQAQRALETSNRYRARSIVEKYSVPMPKGFKFPSPIPPRFGAEF